MTKKVEIKYETAPGTQVDGGYFVPDMWVTVRRPGFIGWLLRLLGSDRGYYEKKMYEALLSEKIAIGKAVYVPRGTVVFETSGNETLVFDFQTDTDELRKSLEKYFKESE